MVDERKVVFGVFDTEADAERCVSALLAANFLDSQISVVMPGEASPLRVPDETNRGGGNTGAVTAFAGAGGLLGTLAGFAAIAIPGIGPLMAAGPFLGLLAGVAAGGTAGGLISAFGGFNMPDEESIRYVGRIEEGRLLLSVHCEGDEECARANEVLAQTGAQDMSTTLSPA